MNTKAMTMNDVISVSRLLPSNKRSEQTVTLRPPVVQDTQMRTRLQEQERDLDEHYCLGKIGMQEYVRKLNNIWKEYHKQPEERKDITGTILAFENR